MNQKNKDLKLLAIIFINSILSTFFYYILLTGFFFCLKYLFNVYIYILWVTEVFFYITYQSFLVFVIKDLSLTNVALKPFRLMIRVFCHKLFLCLFHLFKK
ncbi:hypothetical protein EDEG_03973 [Edhazardia aedis USNM 41457]|uniref:Uncharacterized protein n=1 Tax=Edhazardia aedis (strain USNM 41457) TaxID=1003232 RepID=J9DJ33_EDHAE|nr:hypothetical protein EDEG_03973 [Edhazardia aedis USNM 41457]|eukprot:EJW01397.1 hypothetical protein EDEG_03973 [Edhazardia aedis USNM 41457]